MRCCDVSHPYGRVGALLAQVIYDNRSLERWVFVWQVSVGRTPSLVIRVLDCRALVLQLGMAADQDAVLCGVGRLLLLARRQIHRARLIALHCFSVFCSKITSVFCDGLNLSLQLEVTVTNIIKNATYIIITSINKVQLA